MVVRGRFDPLTGRRHRRVRGLPAVPLDRSHQSIDEGRVELGPGAVVQLGDRFGDGAGTTVGPGRGHAVERVGHRETVVALLKPVMATRTTADWITTLEAANVPCGPINTVEQVFAEPQAKARGFTVSLPHDEAGPIDLVASPLRLEKTPPEYHSAPPLLGQHTDAVLGDVLGLTAPEIAQLKADGIL